MARLTTRAQGSSREAQRAQANHPTPECQVPDPRQVAPCDCCRGREFWASPWVRWICSACHPPADPSTVVERMTLPADESGVPVPGHPEGKA